MKILKRSTKKRRVRQKKDVHGRETEQLGKNMQHVRVLKDKKR